MRGNLGTPGGIEQAVNNIILGHQTESIKVPSIASLEDMLWKFKDALNPVALTNCSKEQLLEIVCSLLINIDSLQKEAEKAKELNSFVNTFSGSL